MQPLAGPWRARWGNPVKEPAVTDQMPPGWENQVPPGPYGQPGYPPYGQSPGYGQPGYPSYGPPGGGQQQGWAYAPAPGGIPLRPLGLGDILNGAVGCARRNPAATFGLTAIVMTAYEVLGGILGAVERSQSAKLSSAQHAMAYGGGLSQQQFSNLMGAVFGVIVPAAVAILLLNLLANAVLTGMLSAVIGRTVIGQKTGLSQAWRAGRAGAVIGTSLLLLLIYLAIPVPVIVAALVLSLLHLAPVAILLAVLGGLATVVMEVLLSIRLSLTLPALVLERIAPRAAIRRSWELTRGSFWRLFGILLLTGLIVVVAAAIMTIPFTIIAGVVAGGTVSIISVTAKVTLLAIVISAIGSILASTITRPVSAGVTVLLYADLRMRREGLDLALRAAAADPQPQGGRDWDAVWRPARSEQPGPAPW